MGVGTRHGRHNGETEILGGGEGPDVGDAVGEVVGEVKWDLLVLLGAG